MLYNNPRERIKELRLKRGYSVKELAKHANISEKFLYKIEEGSVGFSAQVLLKLANALNVSCDYILKGNENKENITINEMLKYFDKEDQESIETILVEIIKMKSDLK